MKIDSRPDGAYLAIKVVPNSSRTTLAGLLGDTLKLKIAQPPESGKANRAIEKFLAHLLDISPSQVSVSSGHTQPRKTVRILSLSAETIHQRLTRHLSPS